MKRAPYFKVPHQTKVAVNIRLTRSTLDYFRSLATTSGRRYQSLIDGYLTYCATHQMRPTELWRTDINQHFPSEP